MIRAHIIVTGRVQGIGFRFSTLTWAKQFGVVGWVRNNLDGSVEIVAEGEEQSLMGFVEKVKRGPSIARVSDCKVEYEEPKNEFASFEITY
ncbi:MAG: acylphosphatase [Candidatus Diapherotrites archaeon]|nr:acylphosphatase [Candidatus Diapherotrites archaeon]